jgi:predicted phage terminase large subunit-like protein
MTNNTDILSAILRTDFKAFVRKVFEEVSGADEFKDNWHIDLICSQLVDMKDGEFNRLVINIPPRSMKSIICSIALPAWLLGHNPESNIICVSYANELSEKLALDCRNVIQSRWYMELFPNMRIDPDRRGVRDFRTTKGGGRFATSTGGTLTGIGAEWIIIDDPLKPADAISDPMRKKVNEWYRSTLLSRLNDKANGKILVIMQRLHEDDLSGYIITTDWSSHHIKLSMIAEQEETFYTSPHSARKITTIQRHVGDLLHPERDSQEIIDKLRADLGEYAFAGQYQQNPAPRDGGLVKKEWFKYYNTPELGRFNRIILSWDTAAKVGIDNAYSACVTIGIKPNGEIWLLNCFRAKMFFTDLLKAALDMYNRAKREYQSCQQIDLLIEDASSGTMLIQELQRAHGINVIAISADKSKEIRMSSITPQIENGTCRFPSYNPAWWADFEKELLTFPVSKYKDQCDAYAQGVEHAKAIKDEPKTKSVTMGSARGSDLQHLFKKRKINPNIMDLHSNPHWKKFV